MILTSDPRASYLAHKAAIDAAIQAVLNGDRYILGSAVSTFEEQFAAWLGIEHAVGVANGTDAIEIALRAVGIAPGDEVITVSHTSVATVTAIRRAGAEPILVDIDPQTYTMAPSDLPLVLNARTRAIVPVHLYGQAADMSAIMAFARAHGLKVVEDCAQAHGAMFEDQPVGTFGDAAAFSFYPTKNLGAIGDGGMVVTRDPIAADRCRAIRQYGWEVQQVSELMGFNSRLDEVQAAILSVKLAHLDANNAQRINHARAYDAELRSLPLALPKVRGGGTHVYHLYVVAIQNGGRDELKDRLAHDGIAVGIHYPVPVHRQPIYAGALRHSPLPNTEHAASHILTLPLYPELTAGERAKVIASLQSAARSGVIS